jgi:dTDP-4-amino-4,6-dideoxygalactose transaminase
MSVGALAAKLEQAKRAGVLPKAVIPVHLCGQPCDLAAIHELGRQYGFRIVEDASHAIGGRYRGEPVGDCRYSDIAVFSFHPVKVITTAEGGMAMTNDAALAKRMQLLRTHGITRDAGDMVQAPDGPWYYEQIALGFNYRMTDVQAALGVSQMGRVDEFAGARNRIAARYDSLLAGLPVVTPWQHPDALSARHLYVVRLKLAEIRRSHREVFEAMRSAGIGVNLHYIPVYRQPYYAQRGATGDGCPEAERYYTEALTLPLYPGLGEAQQDRVVRALRESWS